LINPGDKSLWLIAYSVWLGKEQMANGVYLMAETGGGSRKIGCASRTTRCERKAEVKVERRFDLLHLNLNLSLNLPITLADFSASC
jgi:hypothetical protein